MLFHKPQKRVEIPSVKFCNESIELVNNFNFLGLILDKNMSWKKHSNMISNKISRNIGIINKLKNILPFNILKLLYNNLVLPHITYCILTWGQCSKRILKLQKKVVRIISYKGKFSHSDPLFNKTEILKIDDLYKLNILKFYYNLKNNCLPAYFRSLDHREPICQSNHSYQTRNATKHYNARPKHAFMNCTVKYALANLLNNTNDIILNKVNTHSFKGFKKYLKFYYISQYKNICTIVNCYSCLNG